MPKRLNIPGNQLHGIVAAADFMKWCNGFLMEDEQHPLSHDVSGNYYASDREQFISRFNILDPHTHRVQTLQNIPAICILG